MNELFLNPSQFIIISHPGETLSEVLSSRNMTQAELALRTGRPLKTINEIIKGKASITPDTALQFERVLGISATFWMNRESQYRESQARQAEQKFLQQHFEWLDMLPIKEMAELGWISHINNPIDQLQELLGYFGLASPEHWLKYWSVSIPNIENSTSFQLAPGSTTAWLRKGEIEAQKLQCNDFQANTLSTLLPYIRSLIGKPLDAYYGDLVNKLAEAGIAFCVVQNLPEQEIIKITRWLSPTKALLQLNTKYSKEKDFWFAFYQGLGHILLHGKREVFLHENEEEDLPKEEEVIRFAIDAIGDLPWADMQQIYSWEILQQRTDQEEDIWSEYVEIPASTQPAREPENTKVDNLELVGWPGLSTGAQRALLAAGLDEEAGKLNEQLFANWFDEQLISSQNAIEQGYYRDAIADLENLSGIIRIGKKVSPALNSLEKAVNMLITLVRQTSQSYADPTPHLRQQIQQSFEGIKERMVSETRKSYSTVAAKTENSLAEKLFRAD